MKSLNKVELIGYIGKDAELKYTPDGKANSGFSLATSDTVVNKETGEKTEITTWHNIVLWEKLAQSLSQYLLKGKRIYVEGKLRTRQFTDKDGIVRYWTSIVGHNVIFLDSNPKESGEEIQNTAPSESEPVPQDNSDEADIPF